MNPRPLSAAVLAGGRSSRLGADKALVSLDQTGPPLIATVLERVRAVASDVFVVASDRPAYQEFGAPVHPDRYAEGGVLGGIATALAVARHDRCLVVSCDMPFLHPGLLHWMADDTRDGDLLIPRIPGESRQGGAFVFQTLHAVYRRSCLPAIEAALAAGRRQVISFFADVTVVPIDLDELIRFDPELWSFFSVNTPDSLATARARFTDTARR